MSWKNRIGTAWDANDRVDINAPDTFNRSLPLGEHFTASVTLQLHSLSASDVGIELVFYRRVSETQLELLSTHTLSLKHENGSSATFSCDIQPQTAGVFEYGFRMFPQHPLLAHRQEFDLVRWL